MKRIALIVVVSLLLPVECFAQLSELVREADRSVFTIYTYDEYGQASGSGTGFFIDSTGVALTNYHVLEGASVATIQTTEGDTYQISEVIGTSRRHDIAKFRVDTERRSVSGLDLSRDRPEKGESIFTIGAPRGLSNTVSQGIVSGIRNHGEMGEVVQISAPISPGSSGSPVINMSGRVIGIATFQRQGGQNLNFAVSARSVDQAKDPALTLASFSTSTDHYFINRRASNQRYLILNSVERHRGEMTLNFTYLNLIIGYGDTGLIWIKTENRNENMYVEDLETGERYYASSSTLGTSRSDGTQIQVGEAVNFHVNFASVPKSTRRIRVREGSDSGWQFAPITLEASRSPSSDNFITSLVGNRMASGRSNEVTQLLSDLTDEEEANADVHNVSGVVEYTEGNYQSAIDHFTEAIQDEPQVDIFYFNRYEVYSEMGNYQDALDDIDSAIAQDPHHPDYYYARGVVHSNLENWQRAIDDFDDVIERMEPGALLYMFRGDALFNSQTGNQSAACNDWDRARNRSEASREIRRLASRRITRYCE